MIRLCTDWVPKVKITIGPAHEIMVLLQYQYGLIVCMKNRIDPDQLALDLHCVQMMVENFKQVMSTAHLFN